MKTIKLISDELEIGFNASDTVEARKWHYHFYFPSFPNDNIFLTNTPFMPELFFAIVWIRLSFLAKYFFLWVSRCSSESTQQRYFTRIFGIERTKALWFRFQWQAQWIALCIVCVGFRSDKYVLLLSGSHSLNEADHSNEIGLMCVGVSENEKNASIYRFSEWASQFPPSLSYAFMICSSMLSILWSTHSPSCDCGTPFLLITHSTPSPNDVH